MGTKRSRNDLPAFFGLLMRTVVRCAAALAFLAESGGCGAPSEAALDSTTWLVAGDTIVGEEVGSVAPPAAAALSSAAQAGSSPGIQPAPQLTPVDTPFDDRRSDSGGTQPSPDPRRRHRWDEEATGADPGPDAVEIVQNFEHFLEHGGWLRRYLVHVPRDYDGVTDMPVVIGLHGGLGRAELQRSMSRMNFVSDESGFIAVYPDGTGWTVEIEGQEVPLLTWNAGGCCGYAQQHGVDDVGFIAAMLDDLNARYAVHPRRVYATGMSNGAMMAYRLAVELPDRIAAIAPVAGAMTLDAPPAPPRAVPVMHFHGLADQFAPFEGGYGELASIPFEHPPVMETIGWWVEVNGCAPEAVVSEGQDYIRLEYEPQTEDGAPVVLYELPEGGHTWPGGVDITADLGTGELIESVDASRLMWAFFQQFELPERAGD